MPALVAHRKDRGGWGGAYDAAPPSDGTLLGGRCLAVLSVCDRCPRNQEGYSANNRGDQVISK